MKNNKIVLKLFLQCFVFFFTIESFSASLRMPARLFGQAVSVRVRLSHGNVKTSIPVWVDLNQKETQFDRAGLEEMGYRFVQGKKLDDAVDAIEVGDQVFQNVPMRLKANLEIAHVPDFSATCCLGVLGRDFFNTGTLEITYAHNSIESSVVWLPTGTMTNNEPQKGLPYSKWNFLDLLMKQSRIIRNQKVEIDLSNQKLFFDSADHGLYNDFYKTRSHVQFGLIPPLRNVVLKFSKSKNTEYLTKQSIRSGVCLRKVNGISAPLISKPDLEWWFFLAKNRSDHKADIAKIVYQKEMSIEFSDKCDSDQISRINF